MEVFQVTPFGFCEGVYKALLTARAARQRYPKKKVYLVGMLVHNEEVVESLKKEGLLLLDENVAPLDEQLSAVWRNQVIVFSAHGHDKALEKIAKKRHLIVFDATCHYVLENFRSAWRMLRFGPVIYVGVKGHMECESFLKNAPKAAFYNVKTGELETDKVTSPKPWIVSQTTLSSEELAAANHRILTLYPGARVGPQRCLATTRRQSAIGALPSDVDAVIVLGSDRSNNTMKLGQIAANKSHRPTYIALNLEAVKRLPIKTLKKVALASGASTSRETFDECLDYLKTL